MISSLSFSDNVQGISKMFSSFVFLSNNFDRRMGGELMIFFGLPPLLYSVFFGMNIVLLEYWNDSVIRIEKQITRK